MLFERNTQSNTVQTKYTINTLIKTAGRFCHDREICRGNTYFCIGTPTLVSSAAICPSYLEAPCTWRYLAPRNPSSPIRPTIAYCSRNRAGWTPERYKHTGWWIIDAEKAVRSLRLGERDTHRCVIDSRSANAPSGITDMSLPCRDLVWIRILNDRYYVYREGGRTFRCVALISRSRRCTIVVIAVRSGNSVAWIFYGNTVTFAWRVYLIVGEIVDVLRSRWHYVISSRIYHFYIIYWRINNLWNNVILMIFTCL